MTIYSILAVPRPREGGRRRGENFWLRLIQPSRSICVSLRVFSLLLFLFVLFFNSSFFVCLLFVLYFTDATISRLMVNKDHLYRACTISDIVFFVLYDRLYSVIGLANCFNERKSPHAQWIFCSSMHAETLLRDAGIVRQMTDAVEDGSAQIRPISAGHPPGFGIGVEGSAGSVQNGCGRATFNPRPPPGAINQPDRRILPLLIRGRR